jgi:hypothetical protein
LTPNLVCFRLSEHDGVTFTLEAEARAARSRARRLSSTSTSTGSWIIDEPESWGPTQADDMLEGRRWHVSGRSGS